MFILSSRYHFYTIFVILCVIAGASSHISSNSSKAPFNQIDERYSSFIDFLLDTDLTRFYQLYENTSNEKPETHIQGLEETGFRQHSRSICAKFLDMLNDNQINFCLKHQDILISIIPRIMDLTREECVRISSDLKWNCSGIDYLLDKSNPLGKYKIITLLHVSISIS